MKLLHIMKTQGSKPFPIHKKLLERLDGKCDIADLGANGPRFPLINK